MPLHFMQTCSERLPVAASICVTSANDIRSSLSTLISFGGIGPAARKTAFATVRAYSVSVFHGIVVFDVTGHLIGIMAARYSSIAASASFGATCFEWMAVALSRSLMRSLISYVRCSTWM